MSTHSPDHRPIRPLTPPTAPAPGRSEPGSGDPEDGGRGRPGIEQLRDIVQQSLSALRRDRRTFFGVFGGTAAVLVLAILLQTPLYESTSLMLVKFGRELVYVPEIGQERSIVAQDKAAVINSELAIMRSQPVLEGVVRDIGVSVLYPGLSDEADADAATGPGADGDAGAGDEPGEEGVEASMARALVVAEAAERLRLALAMQGLPEADVIQVSFQHPDPMIAAATVNALVDRFLDAHLSAFAEPKMVRFLEQRVNEYDQRLSESEQALRAFESEHPAFALDNPHAVLVQQGDEARLALAQIDDQMAAIRLRHLQEDASVAQARAQLLALEVEATRLKGRLQSEARDQIAVIKRFIAQRKAEVERELEVLETRRAELEQRILAIDQELTEMPKLASVHRRLLRERDVDEQQYNTYAKRLRDARLSGEMDRERIASINVIQTATPAPRAVWPPSKGMSVAVALVLAAIAAALVVILRERMDLVGLGWLEEPSEKRAAG